MKILKYFFNGVEIGMTWNEYNEAIAANEADYGKYTIEEVAENTMEE